VIRFYDSTLGKKAVMAITGVILFGYVLGHMIGNLLIFSPHHYQINHYAAFLHSNVNSLPLLIIRAILLAAVMLHIVAAVQLAKLKSDARPVGYIKKKDPPTTYAARTMIWSGPIIAAFVIFHVLHLTAGKILPLHELGYRQPDVRYNIVNGFHHRPVALFYILAMALLCLHLYHGLWSMLQSLGWIPLRHLETARKLSAAFAILVCLGFVSVPIGVMAGVVKF
jgi:succinate dehydrogenase / fumarate reductase, cytochrome b subunit